ncbi:hypothetical protein C8J57DRAFT_1192186 [Mycena rebaudengoi]|nr:hypothetical protein C8J57DRAFT_1192186 [Mycena rebaudengoi]
MRCTSARSMTLWSCRVCSGTTRRSRAWNGKPLNHFFDNGVGINAQLLDRQQRAARRGKGRHEPGPPDAPCLGCG